MKDRFHGAIALVFVGLLVCTGARAQPQGQPLTPCPAPTEVSASDLHGLWHFSLWSSDGQEAQAVSRGAMLLEAHPEYPDRVRGRLLRSRVHDEVGAQVSGNVIEGQLHLDESDDGLNKIASPAGFQASSNRSTQSEGIPVNAVWTGVLSPTECRINIRGIRLATADGRISEGEALRFRLHKVP